MSDLIQPRAKAKAATMNYELIAASYSFPFCVHDVGIYR